HNGPLSRSPRARRLESNRSTSALGVDQKKAATMAVCRDVSCHALSLPPRTNNIQCRVPIGANAAMSALAALAVPSAEAIGSPPAAIGGLCRTPDAPLL